MTAEIRPATRDDFPCIWGLLKSKAEFDGGADLLSASYEEAETALFGDNPCATVLIAVVDGVPVGIATFFVTFSTFLAKPCMWLDDLFVHVDYRGQRIGKLLIVKLAEYARRHGLSRIDWTVASGNERGIAFYRSVGATIRSSSLSARLDQDAINHLLADTTK